MCVHDPYYEQTRLEEYLNRWHNISAYAAAEMLIKLGCSKDTFVSDEESEQYTPEKILQLGKLADILAREVKPISFLGGPYPNTGIFQGSLLTLLVDRLLLAEEAACFSRGC